MPDPDVMTALREHWDDVAPRLLPEELALLARTPHLIESASDEEGARRALSEALTVIAARLPFDHPVALAAAGRLRLRAAPPADWPRIAHAFRSLPIPPGLAAAPAREVDEADAWLLAAPSLTEREVRARGADPARSGLIRLTGPEGAVALPAFQFGADGQPVPVVLAVNALLDADDDPWGVADWWLGRNGWLEGSPAELLGRLDDTLLIEAARAELSRE